MDYSPLSSSVHGILQARILEWVSCSLFQGIFPTQRSNPGLPHCRQILYHLSHQRSPRKLKWVGSLSLLQEIVPTQGLNPGLLHTSKANNNLGGKKEKIRLVGTEARDEGEGVIAGWSSKDVNIQL